MMTAALPPTAKKSVMEIMYRTADALVIPGKKPGGDGMFSVEECFVNAVFRDVGDGRHFITPSLVGPVAGKRWIGDLLFCAVGWVAGPSGGPT